VFVVTHFTYLLIIYCEVGLLAYRTLKAAEARVALGRSSRGPDPGHDQIVICEILANPLRKC